VATNGRRGAGHRGETLVETLLTVVLLGILASGIVGALFTTIRVSDLDAQQAVAEPLIRSYAEAWRRVPYAPCTAGSSVDPYAATAPPGFTLPSGASASVISVRFWDGTSTAPASFVATCPAGGDQGFQQLTLRVQTRRGPAQTLTIGRRRQ
jgi:type II secretory pathway pseudopilin PulG